MKSAVDRGRGTSEINTIVQRAIRLDADGNGTGGAPDLEGFLITELNKLHPEWASGSPLRDAEVLKLMGETRGGEPGQAVHADA